MSTKLFTGLTLGPIDQSIPFKTERIHLKHRVVMAPLTRCRAIVGDCVLTDNTATYYHQRASEGGLIVSEASQITPQGQGSPNTPGIYSQEQIEQWKKITEAVHKKGGFIFLQLWHVGRARYGDSVSASAIGLKNFKQVNLKTFEQVDPEVPKELTIEEIAVIVSQYGTAAKNARLAGFDGVEIHGANGYLVDQFIQDGTNQRTDGYGGSITNRLRFLKEVVQAAIEGWEGESHRVGVRISPSGTIQEMSDSTPIETFTAVATLLDKFNLAYLHIVEPRTSIIFTGTAEEMEAMETGSSKQLKEFFSGPIIASGGFKRSSAIEIVEEGSADLVAFGRHFIATPDLPYRLENDLPLNPYDRASFYTSDSVVGYIDYPTYDQLQNE